MTRYLNGGRARRLRVHELNAACGLRLACSSPTAQIDAEHGVRIAGLTARSPI